MTDDINLEPRRKLKLIKDFFVQTVAMRETKLYQGHHDTLAAIDALGMAQTSVNHYEDTEKTYRKLLE